MGIENSPPGSRFGLFGANEAGLQLLFQPIRVAANVERYRVMQQAIQDRGGDHAVAEDVAPLAASLGPTSYERTKSNRGA